MKPSLSCRPFSETHRQALELMVMALYEEDGPGEHMSRAKITRTIEAFSQHPEKGQIILLCLDRTVVGYAIIIKLWSNEFGGDLACLDEFYVTPLFRNKGIGSAFISHVISASDNAFQGIQVAVNPLNRRALDFYERCGLTPSIHKQLFMKIRS